MTDERRIMGFLPEGQDGDAPDAGITRTGHRPAEPVFRVLMRRLAVDETGRLGAVASGSLENAPY